MTLPDRRGIRLGDCEVHAALDEIRRAGTTIKLEPRAMRVLLYLIDHRDEVVSVETLLDQIWPDVVVTSDSVYTTVAALRRALGDDSRDPTYIANVPRRGYRLLAHVGEPDAAASPAVPAGMAALTPTPTPPPSPVPASTAAPTPTPAHTAVPAASASATSNTRSSSATGLWAIAMAVVAGGAFLAVSKPWLRPVPAIATRAVAAARATAPPVKSIAVLPFLDLSEKKDQEYFSDGLSEELIDHLAHTRDLKVIARTSSFQFKGRNEDMRAIGQKLGVAHLLEGSVRRSGNTVRVTAQLIAAQDGTHLWSETYDRQVDDLFRVQDEIAARVVSALNTTMVSWPARPGAHPPRMDSYNEVLRGRYFRQRNTRADSLRSIAALRRAIELDPGNAEAWVELGETYKWQGVYGWIPPMPAYAAARHAVDRALALDPDRASAHVLLGALEWDYVRDFPASRAEYQRAYALDPTLATTSYDDALWDMAEGHPERAVPGLRRFLQTSPLDTWALDWLADALLESHRYGEAEQVVRNVIELNPEHAGAHSTLGAILLAARQLPAALAEMQKESDECSRYTGMADVLWALDRRRESDASLGQAQRECADTSAYDLASSYAARADLDQAFRWLDRAYDNHEPTVTFIRSDTDLVHSLQADPRFADFLAKIRLHRS